MGGEEEKPAEADVITATAGKVASFCRRKRGIFQPPEGSLDILDELHIGSMYGIFTYI